MRFFTVPDAKAARGSVGWAVFLIGAFYIMVMIVGVGARAILGGAAREAAGPTGNLAMPELAPRPRRRRGLRRRRHLPRHHLRGRARDDPRGRRRARDLGLRRGRPRPLVQRRPQGPRLREGGGLGGEDRGGRDRRARDRSSPIAGGAGFNVSVLVGMAFCFASSVNFPALLLALWWRALQHDGRRRRHAQRADRVDRADRAERRRCGRAPTPTRVAARSLGLDNPAIFCIPIGFLGCYLGTVLSKERATTASTTSSTCARRRASGPRGRRRCRCAASRASRRRSPCRRERRVVELTQELIQTRTVNPPGDEEKAASLLAARLEAAGLEVTRARARAGADEPRRAHPGRGERPALCLTGHLDTVPLGGATGRATRSPARSTATACTGAARAT